jgi:PAS domain S-box-containing protein
MIRRVGMPRRPGRPRALPALLPEGGRLSPREWWPRHRAVLLLLWAHVPGTALFGTAVGVPAAHAWMETLPVAVLASLATWPSSPRLRSSMAALGLVTSSAVLVHLSGGVIEMHFHFLVMMAVITLYHDWLPLGLAAAYVVLHHAVIGALAPPAVFNHPDAVAQPLRWAAIHIFFILCGSLAGVVSWRLNERSNDELRRARELFKDAFDGASIGMALVALDGRWLEVNRSVCEITGYSAAELLTKRFQDITHPDDLAEDVELLRRLVDGEISSFQLEKRYLHADGRAVPILLSVTLVRDPDGTPQHFVSQIEDLSERKRAEEYYRRLYEGQRALVRELEEAHRLKSELFNIVSHEFKTPLAGIIGFAGLLSKRGDRLDEGQKERYLETIARQAERLNRLVENLFVSARQIEPSSGAVADPDEALSAVRAQLSDTYEDVGFDVDISPGLRPSMSQEALRLVLLNLASNAVKHAAPNSNVEIVARREGPDVVVAVTNVGEPIPADTAERIFEPFVQADVGSRTADGVGLGLHIVRKLITAYDGSISVDSATAAVTFEIRIPEASSADVDEDAGGRELFAAIG